MRLESAVNTGDATMEWIERASCLEEDPELFFPVGTTGPAIEQTARAKAVCLPCDVRAECLAWALDTCQDAGVWGGLDEEERREIRRARRRAAAAASAELVAV
jgi:WhiB family redox-sensing transcriptional regulator